MGLVLRRRNGTEKNTLLLLLLLLSTAAQIAEPLWHSTERPDLRNVYHTSYQGNRPRYRDQQVNGWEQNRLCLGLHATTGGGEGIFDQNGRAPDRPRGVHPLHQIPSHASVACE